MVIISPQRAHWTGGSRSRIGYSLCACQICAATPCLFLNSREQYGHFSSLSWWSFPFSVMSLTPYPSIIGAVVLVSYPPDFFIRQFAVPVSLVALALMLKRVVMAAVRARALHFPYLATSPQKNTNPRKSLTRSWSRCFILGHLQRAGSQRILLIALTSSSRLI